MYQSFAQSPRQRAATVVAVAALHALAIWALVTGLGARVARQAVQQLNAIELPLDPPSPRPSPEPRPTTAPKPARAPAGAAAPEGRTAPAAQVAPPMPIVIVPPRPAAPVAGSGNGATGTGAGDGGTGSGTGNGTVGSGAGSGTGGVAVHARQIKGTLSRADYPAALRKAGIGGAVSILVTIGPTGLADACAIVRSSGVAELDAMTCALVRARYLFTPARDAAGRPTTDWVRETHVWWSGHKPVPAQVPPATPPAP